MERNEMPVGLFAMAMVVKPYAMRKLAMRSEEKKQEIIAGKHSVKSRDKTHQYVNALVSDKQ